MIDIAHVSKVYSRGLYALRDLSLTIESGEFVFLTGASGAGKSTLLRLLLREEMPTTGEVVVNGQDLAFLKRGALQPRRRVPGLQTHPAQERLRERRLRAARARRAAQ